MLTALLIVLREVLEAALIGGVILAATKGVRGRMGMFAAGVGGGVAGAIIFALLITQISSLFEGSGQEVFNAAILLLATGMLAWHVIWMSQHGKELMQKAKSVGHAVQLGAKPLSALAFLIGAAVWREGSEIVLFLQGMLAGADSQHVLLGAMLGLIGGVALGAVMYFGLVRLPIGLMFRATNGLLILIAGGMAAKAALFLSQTGWLTVGTQTVWDMSDILPAKSMLGTLLDALMGYTPTPTSAQLIFFIITALGIVTVISIQKRRQLT